MQRTDKCVFLSCNTNIYVTFAHWLPLDFYLLSIPFQIMSEYVSRRTERN